jgi:hypothetical protein
MRSKSIIALVTADAEMTIGEFASVTYPDLTAFHRQSQKPD